MCSINNRYKYSLFILSVLFLFSMVTNGCSSRVKQPGAGKTKVLFSEWRIDEEKGSFISTVSVAALGDDKKKILLNENSRIDGLKVSPDGSQFAYLVDYDRLLVSGTDGKEKYSIDDMVGGWPNWSPDGTRLAYVKLGNASGSQKSAVVVYTLKDGKKKTVQLGKYGTLKCAVLDWYPDGTSVTVFAGGEGMSSSTLVKVNVETEKLDAIAKNAQSRGFVAGDILNIVRDATDTRTPGVTPVWEVWQGKDSDSLQKVIKGPLSSNFITPSNDGKKLAYTRTDKKSGTQLYIADYDGKNEKRITDLKECSQLLPQWSADDRYVIFSDVTIKEHKPAAYLYYYDTETRKTSTVIKGSKEPMTLGTMFAVY